MFYKMSNLQADSFSISNLTVRVSVHTELIGNCV